MTSEKEQIVLSWSGGKDSAMAAYHLLATREYDIVGLLTTVTEGHDRISMHGVRRELLERQALALKLPLITVMIPQVCRNEVYESRMSAAFNEIARRGIRHVAFGDLFLREVREYRERQLADAGLLGVYPIWMRDTNELVRSFIGLGFKALLACVDTHAMDGQFAGREIDLQLLTELPSSADPCGENGEYHSFVYDGPIFVSAIACRAGERILRDARFNYCDILPA